MISRVCQRWLRREPSWRRPEDGGFDRRAYRMAPIGHRLAKRFVLEHHYSGRYPAAKRRYGMVEVATGQLVGVAVIGVPTSRKVLTNPFPSLDYDTAAVLSRFVLLDGVPANGESWLLGQVFDAAAAEGLRGLVAFSDPLPRVLGGTVVMPGHIGAIYKVTNAGYTGRGQARTLKRLPDGTILDDRSAQKVRAGEPGGAGTALRLHALGAPPRRCGETGSAWLRRAHAAIGTQNVKHPGNHRWVWKLGNRTQRRATAMPLEVLPPPVAPDPLTDRDLVQVAFRELFTR